MATIVSVTGAAGSLLSESALHSVVRLKGTYDYDVDGAAESGDVIQILTLPAGFIRLQMGATLVREAFNASVTLNVGLTGGDTDGFQPTATLDPQTAATVPTMFAGAYTYSAETTAWELPVQNTTADTIDVLVGGAAITQGVLDVWVLGFFLK